MNRGDSVDFVVPGRPVPLGRPRFGGGKARTPDKSRAAQAAIGLLASPHFHGDISMPVDVELMFVYAIPKSWPTWRKERAADQRERPRAADVDNLAKQVLDALNGIAFDDDVQVVSLACSKHYVTGIDDDAFTHIIVRYPDDLGET